MITGNGLTSRNMRICNIYICLLTFIILGCESLSAQENYTITHNDSLALESIMVEKYYVSDSTDNIDTTADALPKGAVTYRIFIDMKPGYSLQLVYGNKDHELVIETSTTFFNNQECRAETGFNIDAKQLHTGTFALDSWITMGAASRLHTGIPRAEDNDGFSFITNRNSLNKIDGLTKGVLPNFQIFNLEMKFFGTDRNASKFQTNNGGWAALGLGVKGPTPENRVLIAQLTTNGNLSFKLNVQIGTPTGGYVKFVADNPVGSEMKFDSLIYK